MKDAVNLEQPMEDESTSIGGEAGAQQQSVTQVRCVCCGEGMYHEILSRFNRGFGMVVLVMGLLISLFMSLLLGLPMVIFGAYLSAASRSVWMCPTCGTVVDRIRT